MTEQPLDLEELAAFLDGKLSGDARARVVKLLAESEEAHEVFTEIVRFREEEQRTRVIPFPSWRRFAVPLAAAAVLALLVATPSMRRLQGPAPMAMGAAELGAARLVAALGTPDELAVGLGADWDQRTWSVTRGGSARLIEPEAAFRLGVRSVDLSLALLLGDSQQADRLAAEILELLSGVEMSQAAAAQYAQLRSRLAAGQEPAGLVADASRAEDTLQELLGSTQFGFGQWSAAAELASRTHDPGFFQSPMATDFLGRIDRLGLDPSDVGALAQVGQLVRDGISETEYSELQAQLRAVIRRNAG